MKHWVGRRVVVHRRDGARVAVEGVLKIWDNIHEKIVMVPGDIVVPFHAIVKIERADMSPSLNSIGYKMKHSIQFDNAVYFRSRVMIWKENSLLSAQSILTAHDAETVTLSNGVRLRKAEHNFVVRSLRGKVW
ncbi:hypothetical protein [Paenibacillus dakarensis]|uniref:hypothetical protein n=1 Tax=Paenibacillus dakarensis TaxID=1527293 RepID=UPI0006D52B00|nr:hypothetical protein [Paenibacillus dakarensis]